MGVVRGSIPRESRSFLHDVHNSIAIEAGGEFFFFSIHIYHMHDPVYSRSHSASLQPMK